MAAPILLLAAVEAYLFAVLPSREEPVPGCLEARAVLSDFCFDLNNLEFLLYTFLVVLSAPAVPAALVRRVALL